MHTTITPREASLRQGGFTIIELMVVVMVIGLITAFIAPNLEAFVPKAKLDKAAKVLVSNVDFLPTFLSLAGIEPEGMLSPELSTLIARCTRRSISARGKPAGIVSPTRYVIVPGCLMMR